MTDEKDVKSSFCYSQCIKNSIFLLLSKECTLLIMLSSHFATEHLCFHGNQCHITWNLFSLYHNCHIVCNTIALWCAVVLEEMHVIESCGHRILWIFLWLMFLPVTILFSKLKTRACLPSDPLSPDYQPVLADPDPPVKINTEDEEPNPQDRPKNTVPKKSTVQSYKTN